MTFSFLQFMADSCLIVNDSTSNQFYLITFQGKKGTLNTPTV